MENSLLNSIYYFKTKNMKKIIILFIGGAFVLSSCNQNEDFSKEITNGAEKIDGSFELSELPMTIYFAGKAIRFELADSIIEDTNLVNMDTFEIGTRADGFESYGPYYVSGTPRSAGMKEQKVLIHNTQSGIAAGTYFADVWTTSGTIILPGDAWGGKIGMPDPSGYVDWSTQKQGVNWYMATTAKGVEINWHFYTLVLKYNSAGALFGWVIPLDGAEVRVPYYYIK